MQEHVYLQNSFLESLLQVGAKFRRYSGGRRFSQFVGRSLNSVIPRTTMFTCISANACTVQRGEVAFPHIEENLAEHRDIQTTPPGQL